MAIQPQSANPVVLVVEDEPILLLYAVRLIEDAGFEALPASNADEAILLLEARADIRVVFTDIDMPGSMDGHRLAAAVRDRWPPVEIILTSGHVRIDHKQLPDRGHFLAKPYSSHELIRTIASLTAA